VTEALDLNGSEFGIGRLIEVIQAAAAESAASIVNRVTETVKAFVGNQPQTDDITLVAIRKL
jgi:sigma-B regulation protein RsbU (phosphoserine phosphatase)